MATRYLSWAGLIVVGCSAGFGTVGSQLKAQPPRQPRVPVPIARLGGGGCPLGAAAWWQQHAGDGGRLACGSDPTRPVVLLFHGLHQDAQTWTAPSHVDYAYDYRHLPAKVEKKESGPNVGIYKIGESDFLYGGDRAGWDKSVNWFDYLAGRGFTVATWSQEGKTFAAAVPSALAAFDSLLAQTAARSPQAAPPVALIGHSRGGLLIRRVLKERGGGGRVKWVVTLNSPHQGSEMGRWVGRVTAEAVDLADCCLPSVITAPFKPKLKDLVTELTRPFTKFFVNDETRELMPDGPLIRDLRSGEQAVPGVSYYTFGGTNPTYFGIYAWILDAESALPQGSVGNVFYRWTARPQAIGSLSPMLDELRDFADEVVPGRGDGLVADQRARLPWSTHTTLPLNHAEVLWDRGLQQRVAQLIDRGTR